MPVVFHDNFVEAVDTQLLNHTPDTGTEWVKLVSNIVVAEIHVKPSGDSGAQNAVGPTTSENSVYVLYVARPAPTEADVRLIFDRHMNNWERTNTYLTGIGARINASGDTGYFLQMHTNAHTNESLRLFLVQNGVSTLLAAYDHSFVNGDVVKFECFDDGKRVYVNDTLVINNSDNTITAPGEAGIYWGALFESGHIRSENEYSFFTIETEAPTGNVIDISAALSGNSSVVASGDLIRGVEAQVSGASNAQVQAETEREVSAGVIGYSLVGAEAEIQLPDALYVDVYGEATVTVSPRMVLSGAATIAGQGQIEAEASIKGLILAEAHIAGISGYSASAERGLGALATVNGSTSGEALAYVVREAGAITRFYAIEIDLCPRCAEEVQDMPYVEDISTDFIIRGV